MSPRKYRTGCKISRMIICLITFISAYGLLSCGNRPDNKESSDHPEIPFSAKEKEPGEEGNFIYTLLVLPKNPSPGQSFRILATGGKRIGEASINVRGPEGSLRSTGNKASQNFPYWRIDDYNGSTAGKYSISLIVDDREVSKLTFTISQLDKDFAPPSMVWKTVSGWDSSMETIYSDWINALFYGCSEQASWTALHEVTRNKDQNFLYDYLSLGEDDPQGKNTVIMQPDCADNPFYLRAYFSWKLGLPFGYHLCDRGSLVHNPKPGLWVTNESTTSKKDAVMAFNAFLRSVMNGVHSGTARTGLDDQNSDYYSVPLENGALRPGVVYADPYGHTLILTGLVPQAKDHPGLLLAVDAQPDGTVGIKRFWKGNFLFNTSGVVGEPGFKAFRPIIVNKGMLHSLKNNDLTAHSGFVPFSLQQRKMSTEVFYHTMERLINPNPLDPETALLDLIQALYEQLLVRVTSVANGEAYFKSNPKSVIPMPSGAAGIFLAGGQWEDFSTPNRDLRLLIAMDAVLDFPDRVSRSPEDFKLSGKQSPEEVRKELQSILDKKVSGLSITYSRSDGSAQELTLSELLKRRDSFEMAYNPNDGTEIRWGAPAKSDEMATCNRHAPSYQLERMRAVRIWFSKRLHPPT